MTFPQWPVMTLLQCRSWVNLLALVDCFRSQQVEWLSCSERRLPAAELQQAASHVALLWHAVAQNALMNFDYGTGKGLP
jgi:hypothetical protein